MTKERGAMETVVIQKEVRKPFVAQMGWRLRWGLRVEAPSPGGRRSDASEPEVG